MDDLKATEKPRSGYRLKRFRDIHHMIARLVAMGVSRKDIGIRTGRNVCTISNLMRDPAFQNIVGLYRSEVDQAYRDEAESFFDICSRNTLAAERMLAERLEQAEDEGEIPSIRELLSISRDGADRIGYGKRTTQVNVNLDFAERLERAVQRTKRVAKGPTGETIEHAPQPAQTLREAAKTIHALMAPGPTPAEAMGAPRGEPGIPELAPVAPAIRRRI